MHLFLVELESGFALSAIYAILSVSLTFTYGVTGVVQLAQGDIMMCGAFAGYFVGVNVPNFWLLLLVGGATTAVLGYLVYQGIFRWLLRAGHLPPLVAGLALSTLIEEILRISFFAGEPQAYPALTWIHSLGPAALDGLVVGIALVLGVGFELGLRLTRVGRNLRATADNVEAARLLGIPAERMRMLAFVLGATLAGIDGILISVVYQSISFDSGGTLEFVAIACILLGGLGSIPGALIGSVVIGVGQALLGTYVSSSYVNALVFGVVLVAIVGRPKGLLGVEPGYAGMNLGGHATAVAIAIAIDVLMALSFYLPMATGALFVLPIGSMGVGGYCAGELAIHGAPLGVVLLGGAVGGAVVSALGGLVVVRMGAWSAAIASVAMVEVLQVLMTNFGPTGGAQGLLGLPLYTPSLLTYILTVAIVLILLVVEQTRVGDAMEAIRGDQLAAECSGVRIRLIRLNAFTCSGAVAGLAGAVAAGFLGFVNPSTYGFAQLNNFLLATILGGSTTAVGSFAGGVAVNILPQSLKFAQNYSLIAFAAIVIVVIIVRPNGLIVRRHIRRLIRFVARRVLHRPTDRPRRATGPPRYLARRPPYDLLRVERVRKAYGGSHVVNDVNIEVRAGEILGIIGANGAGKTTLVNLLTGVVPADGGTITVSVGDTSRALRRPSCSAAVRMGIARTFQNGRIFPGMTTREQVSVVRGSDGDTLLGMVGMQDRGDETASSLPYGDQRLVEIARALATRPRFLIMDEPAAGMSSDEAAKVADIARRLSTDGMAVVIIDHNVEFISGVSDRMVAIDFGEVIASGSPHEVLANPDVEEAYLGRTGHPAPAEGVATSGKGGTDGDESVEAVLSLWTRDE